MRIKYLFEGLIYLTILVSLVLYVEDYHRGMLFLIGVIALLTAKLISYLTDVKQKCLVRFGTIASISGFFLALGVGVHVRQFGDTIEIVSPFYTHSLAKGERIDTVSLASSYEVYYFSYEPYREDFYVLHNKDSCELWNKYRRILSAKEFSFVDKDWWHGNLQVVKIKGDDGISFYDLYGRNINEDDYRPHLIDRTPPDITY